jgi:hypothetical protein
MARKNFDIDTQNLLTTNTDYKKRKNPKDAVLSSEIIYAIVGITIVGLAIHMTCLFFFSQQFSGSLSNFQVFVSQSMTITSPYHASCELSNEVNFLDQLNQYKLDLIRSNLSLLENNMTHLYLTPTVNTYIVDFFFRQSCSYLLQYYNISTE